jgi:hypothetical protein
MWSMPDILYLKDQDIAGGKLADGCKCKMCDVPDHQAQMMKWKAFGGWNAGRWLQTDQL